MVAHRKGRQHQGGIAARPGATALCASKRVIGYRGKRTSLARSIISEKCQETTWLLYERLGT